jgi:type VI secretion system secreted protein VgrG
MAGKKQTRKCKVTSPLGEDALQLTALDARERVSGLFELDCRFVSGDDQIDFAKIIGQGITLELEMAGEKTRFFNGRVARFAQADAEGSAAVYQARIVPWFWFLTRRSDCRIFQRDSVTQILEKVFAGHKQIADFKLDIEGTFDPIPYCVQYRETDFNFASRLMEEFGIGYYFEHGEKAHKMVLFNAPSKILACPGQPKASTTTAEADEKTPGHVFDFQVRREFRSGAYALTDYNFRDPGLDLAVLKKTRQGIGGNEAFEIFDYPGDYQALGTGDKRAQLRMEAEECAAHAIQANSSCHGFTPGFKFDLVGHARESFNDTYLITDVHHTFTQSVGGGRDGAGSEYRNSFGCIPHAIPFRPPEVTPRPVIQGAQTAMVVGGENKEIDIDDLGCVFVKFHWDRNAKGDATSSCRIRVSEAWAGKAWGSFFAPRVGQEVIVEFLEGDPNRPIITGRVYNGASTPPYKDGSQSGFKSRSTAKGEAANFNEIRFDDKKGHEQLSIHAERNMSTSVEADQSLSVGGNRSGTVTKDDKLEVKKNQTVTVTEAYKLTAKSVVAQSTTNHVHVLGKEYVSVACEKNGMQVYPSYVSVGTDSMANHTTWDKDGVTVHGVPKVTIDAGGSKIEVSASGIKITSSQPVEVKGSLIKLNV